MRPVARNQSKNLRAQAGTVAGRGPEPVEVSAQRPGVSMIAPGEGTVEDDFGAATMHPRSAANAGRAVAERFGGR